MLAPDTIRDNSGVPTQPLRIVLVEDERLTRGELERMLARRPEFQIVGSFSSAETALAKIPELPVDLVLMDLRLGPASGAECTRQLKQRMPSLKVVILTKYEEPDYIFEALRAGADGYLLKKFKEAELANAVLQAAAGGAPMSGEVASRVLKFFHEPNAHSALDQLSAREREVLQLLARGFAYKEIAQKLGLSRDTVNDHIRRIYKKLKVHSALAAVRLLREG